MIDPLSGQFCETYCSGLGYSYFGLQYGIECWCGDEDTDVTQWGTAVCDMECSGDSTQTCGGRYAFDAYSIDETDDDSETDDATDNDLAASCVTCPCETKTDGR